MGDVGMLKVGQYLSLVAEAPKNELLIHTLFDELYSDFLLILIVIAHSHIDRAHSALTDNVRDSIGANSLTDQRVAVGSYECFGSLANGSGNVFAAICFVSQQRIDLAAQFGIIGAGLIQKWSASVW
jgi:hypothetical protein